MTHLKLRHGLLTLATAALTLPAASAIAADVTPQTTTASATFIAKSAADSRIREGAKAFKRGDFERSISYSRSALKQSLSRKRAAIAHSNLCAAYASIGEMEKASASCHAALELRPGYEPAVTNKAALTIRLANK